MLSTKNNFIKAGAVTVMLSVFSVTAFAKGHMDKIIKKLDLTPEQATSLKSFHKEHKATKALHKADRMKVKALLDAGDVDGAATLASEQASSRVYQMAKAKEQLATFLSEEQIEKLQQIKERKMRHHGKNYHSHNE